MNDGPAQTCGDALNPAQIAAGLKLWRHFLEQAPKPPPFDYFRASQAAIEAIRQHCGVRASTPMSAFYGTPLVERGSRQDQLLTSAGHRAFDI